MLGGLVSKEVGSVVFIAMAGNLPLDLT